MKAKVGDWVRFYRNGELVIGVVQYVRGTEMGVVDPRTYMTDHGPVSPDSVLEVRNAGG